MSTQGITGHWVSREIIHQAHTATALVKWLGGCWSHVIDPRRAREDTGVRIDLGPHEWWKHLDADTMREILAALLKSGAIERTHRLERWNASE